MERGWSSCCGPFEMCHVNLLQGAQASKCLVENDLLKFNELAQNLLILSLSKYMDECMEVAKAKSNGLAMMERTYN